MTLFLGVHIFLTLNKIRKKGGMDTGQAVSNVYQGKAQNLPSRLPFTGRDGWILAIKMRE